MGEAAVAAVALREMATPSAAPRSAPSITYEEAAELEAVSVREIQRRVGAGELARIETGQIADNGRPVYAIPVESLSPPARQAYWALRKAEQDVATRSQPASVALPTLPNGQLDLAACAAEGRLADVQEMSRRAEAVKQLRDAQNEHPDAGRMALCAQIGVLYGVSAATIRRWDEASKAGGVQSLAPGWSRRPGMGARAMSPGCQAAALACHRTQQRMTGRQIWLRVVTPYCHHHAEPPPSYATVRRFLEDAQGELERRAFRLGRKHYESSLATRVLRDLESVGVYEILCGDCRKLDLFAFGPDGRPIRPWVVFWVDVRSALIAGWSLRPLINTRAVALAFRSALLRYGLPQTVLTDNGHEYCNRYFGGRLAYLDSPPPSDLDRCDRFPAALPTYEEQTAMGLFATLGIGRVTALPYHAWSKPIESLFNAFFKPHENLIPGWCGRDHKDAPEVLKKYVSEGKLLTWPQLSGLLGRWIEEWNDSHVCGDRGKPPARHFDQFIPRIPDRALLDVLLEPVEKRRITQFGIQLDPDHIYNSEALAIHVGEWCSLRYDPDDRAAITVFLGDGSRVAVPAMPKARWGEFGPANEIAAQCRRAQRKHLSEIAALDRAHTAPAYADPEGAYRMVAQQPSTITHQPSQLAAQAREIQRERAEVAKTSSQAHGPQDGLARSYGQQFLREVAQIARLAQPETER